jgi:hypothetical protein
MVEVGPVHCHQDVAALAELLRHPTAEAIPNVDACIAHQPVDLLDCVLGHQPARLSQRLTDHRHRQRRTRHHAQRGRCQRIHPLGVQVRSVQTADKAPHLAQTSTRNRRLDHAPHPFPVMHTVYKAVANRGYSASEKMRGFMRPWTLVAGTIS